MTEESAIPLVSGYWKRELIDRLQLDLHVGIAVSGSKVLMGDKTVCE